MAMNFSELSGLKQWATVLLGGALVTGALYFTAFKSQNDKNAAAEKAVQDKVKENNELESYRPKLKDMERQLAWGMGKPGEDALLSAQSDTEAYYGRLGKAQEFSWRAVESARRADANETSALWRANAAVREAEFGNSAQARRAANAALAIAAVVSLLWSSTRTIRKAPG